MPGKPVPDFSLASTDRSSSDGPFRLPARPGTKLFLCFYQKMRFPLELISENLQEVLNFAKAL